MKKGWKHEGGGSYRWEGKGDPPTDPFGNRWLKPYDPNDGPGCQFDLLYFSLFILVLSAFVAFAVFLYPDILIGLGF